MSPPIGDNEVNEPADSLNQTQLNDDDNYDNRESEEISSYESQDIDACGNIQEPMDGNESELDTTFLDATNMEDDSITENIGFLSCTFSDVTDSDSVGSDDSRDPGSSGVINLSRARQLDFASQKQPLRKREQIKSITASQKSPFDIEKMRQLMIDHYSFSQTHVMDYDSSLVAPIGYQPIPIPHNAPRKFMSAREYWEMSQQNASQIAKPLNEEIEVNDFVVSLQREHYYNENEEEPMQIDDEAIDSHESFEEDFESLDQSLKELSEKIDLETSLKYLSQKLDSKIIDYAEQAVKSLEKSPQDLLKDKAIKEMQDKLNNADLEFNTQEYENIITKHCSQVQYNADLVNVQNALLAAGYQEKELSREERAELGRQLYYEKLKKIENAKAAREFEEFNAFKMSFGNTSKAGTSTGGYTKSTAPQSDNITRKRFQYSSDSSDDEDEWTERKRKEMSKDTSGFVFASGKKLEISDAISAAAAKQKFDESFEQSKTTNNQSNQNTTSFETFSGKNLPNSSIETSGFSFASGKKLVISENVASRIKAKFNEISRDTSHKTTENSTGFAFASGRNLKITNESIESVKNKFEENNKTLISTSGFAFASGKNLKVSNRTAEIARKKFDESDVVSTTNQTAESFAFASGKNLQVSTATAELAKKKFDISDESIQSAKLPGFSFASGKNLAVPEKAVENVKRKFDEVELSDDSKENDSKMPRQQISNSVQSSKRKLQESSQNTSQQSLNRSTSSFVSFRSRTKSKDGNNSFSNGTFNSSSSSKSQSFLSLRPKRVEIGDDDPFESLQSSKILQKRNDLPAKISNKSLETLQHLTESQKPQSKMTTRSQTRNDPFSSSKPTDNSINMFKLAVPLGKPRTKSEADPFQSPLPLKRQKISQSPFSQKFNIQKPLFAPMHASSPIVTTAPNPSRAMSFKAQKSMAIQSPIVPDNLFELLDEIKPDSKPKTKKQIFDYSMYRLNNLKNNENKDETPTTPVRSMQPFRTNWKRRVKDMTLSQRLRDFDALMALDPEMSLSQYDRVNEAEIKEIEKIKAEETLNKMRREELEKLKEYIENKPAIDTKPLQGILYKKRQNENFMQDEIEEVVAKNVFDIKNNEVIKYKFDVKDLLNSEEDLFVIIADNAKLVIGENFKVGFEEIKIAFLSSPGVDPKLLHKNWTENAYELIGAKLIWLENNLESFKGAFKPENLLLHLKYHYDREIDLSERSAIRKITELDDVPQRRMILKVHEIYFLPDRGYELELTDGWYKIRVTVDKCIASAIDEKEIEIHTKLVIGNAILINPTQRGHHPLDLPESIKLKISGNSTRVAHIDSTLGYCKNAFPFQVPLDSISGEGGVIGLLRVYITHVYALVYVASDNDNKKSFRSEKMQRRIDAKNEMIFSRLYTDVYEKVLKEYREDIKERVTELKSKAFSDYSIEDICQIFEYDQHDSYFCNDLWNKMSGTQKSQVEVYQNELKQKLKESTLKRMESIEQNKAVSMLKFRVVDEKEPQNTAIVNWYQPSDDLLNLIKEGRVIEMSGAIALPTTDEMFIYATSKVNYAIGDAENEEKYQEYLRKETKLSEIKVDEFKPSHNQFDIACMIVRIGEKLDRGYQPIYVVDEHQNFLEIKFVPNIAEHAYDNVLKVGATFFIRDLQWYNASCEKNSLIPTSSAVSDTTVFVINPRKETHRMRLEELRTSINDDYKKDCIEKLEELIPTKIPLKISTEDNPQLAKRFVFRHYGKPCGARRFHF